MSKKAVIFDVGGVLIRTPDRQTRKNLETRLSLAEWESEEIVFNSEMGTKAQLGEITDEELWKWVGQYLDLSATELEVFRTEFWAGDVLDKDLVNLIHRFHNLYQTAIISNATDALRENLKSLGIYAAFDLIVCSAEEKIMKPDLEIYERTLRRLGREPFETVFIDDSQVNVIAAQEVGMDAIHFKPEIDFIKELKSFDIQPGEEI